MTYSEVISKMVNTIKSCETEEQLDNTHKWCYSILNNKVQHNRYKSLSYRVFRDKFYNIEGIMRVLIVLINLQRQKITNIVKNHPFVDEEL